MQKIGVFLSSYTDIPLSFLAATEAVGKWLGETKRTLVYGGAQRGMMEVLAATTKQYGGRIYGVIPQILYDRNLVSSLVDVEFRTADLNDRKAVLMRESDILVALPGGIGTLDEIFTVLAANSIGMEQKTVVLFEVENYWQPLLDYLHHGVQMGIVPRQIDSYLKVVRTVEELEVLCQ